MIPCQQYGWHEEKYQVVMNPGFKRETDKCQHTDVHTSNIGSMFVFNEDFIRKWDYREAIN